MSAMLSYQTLSDLSQPWYPMHPSPTLKPGPSTLAPLFHACADRACRSCCVSCPYPPFPRRRDLQLRDYLLPEHPDRCQGLLVRGAARLAQADNEIIRLDLRLPPLQLCQTVVG